MTRSLVCIAVVATTLFPCAGRSQVTLGPAGPVSAKQEGTQRPDEAKAFKLTVDPAGEPVPALKHSLVPSYQDQTPGNAVPYYYRAVLAYQNGTTDYPKDFWDEYAEWIKMPPAELPKKEVNRLLGRLMSMFTALTTAAYREHCDWDWRLRDTDGVEAIAFLLPEIQQCRGLARMLGLKARLEISEGRYEDAIETLCIGYRLARDITEPPLLVNDLVGIAIANMMNVQLLALIDAPGSPNMYWAVASLPESLIAMQKSFRFEMTLPARVFPFLKDAETAERSAEQWKTLLVRAARVGEMLDAIEFLPDSRDPDWQAELVVTALIAKEYPRVKRQLIAAGYAAEQVEKMCAAQVIAIHQAHAYEIMYHEMFKWSLLPPSEALGRAEQSRRKLDEAGYFGRGGVSREVIPIAESLLPAVAGARRVDTRLRVRLAGLRALEAIRMYAATHDGKLPKSLGDITQVPVPNVPFTGKPFTYRLDGERAILDIPDVMHADQGWRFEITVVSSAQ